MGSDSVREAPAAQVFRHGFLMPDRDVRRCALPASVEIWVCRVLPDRQGAGPPQQHLRPASSCITASRACQAIQVFVAAPRARGGAGGSTRGRAGRCDATVLERPPLLENESGRVLTRATIPDIPAL
jgi:hypothetical protein